MRQGAARRDVGLSQTPVGYEGALPSGRRTRSFPVVGPALGDRPRRRREKPSSTRNGCDVSQSVCPWNARFAQELQTPEFAPREFLANKDARQLARDVLGMTQAEFSTAFKGSPMKRAKLRGLKRNAAVALGNVGTADDARVLTRALDDDEPLVREHAAWALARLAPRIASPDAQAVLRGAAESAR